MTMRLRFFAAAFSLAGCGGAYAQQAGDNLIQLGYGHVLTLDSSQPLRTTLNTSVLTDLLGIRSPFVSPGTESSVGDSSTVFFSMKHFFSDHIAVAADGGIPAHFKISGHGVIRPTGVTGTLFNVDLGDRANNPLATAKQWTPAMLAQYYFGAATAELRPFVGIGASYTWFTQVNLDPNFEAASEANFGQVLALANGKPRPTHVTAYASSSFQPLFNLGVTQRITSHWSLSASMTYAMLHTRADIKIKARDDTVLSDSTTRIGINPLAMTLFLGYNFGPGIPFLHH
ncbi:MAG: rane protein [Nevskia sp.]|nr:rane protein [Nevskia sp.]